MKCPKCGYLGFETSERCRNCGYDFSLSVQGEPAELPLHMSDHGHALADFDLGDFDAERDTDTAGLDLDRVIGDEPGEPRSAIDADRVTSLASAPAAPAAPRAPVLPLFARDDEVAAPRPAGPPLAVRRTTPEIPRGRTRTPPVRPDTPGLALELDSIEDPIAEPRAPAVPDIQLASAAARLGAMAIDLVLLAAINGGVVYLTLALAGLSLADAGVLPMVPFVGFLAMLNGGYLVTFIAASGQTIGKMATGIRVIGDDDQRVDVPGAVLRAAGCGVSLLTAGLGYLPAFVTADRRALQDRIAGTRVVSAR